MVEPYYKDALVEIWLGDCRELLLTLPKVDLVLTDPPYGMNYNTNGKRFTLGGRSLPPVHGDDQPFDPTPWLNTPYCVLWGFNHFPSSLPAGGCLVYLKRSDAAFGQFLSDAEVAWNKHGRGVYAYRDTHFSIASKRSHPTEKPVGLMCWSIEQSGAPKTALILDPYMGAGSTLKAAKLLNRKAIGIEIEERYCEIAAKRCESIQAGLFDAPVVPVAREPQAGLFSD